MGIISKIKKKIALRRAKIEEKKNIPSKKDLLIDQKQFLEEAKIMKSMITKKKLKKTVNKKKKQTKNL